MAGQTAKGIAKRNYCVSVSEDCLRLDSADSYDSGTNQSQDIFEEVAVINLFMLSLRTPKI